MVEPVSAECQPVNDGYVHEAEDFYAWLRHVKKFPIAEKYEHIQALGGSIGALDFSVAARLFTADDCSEARVKEFVGGNLDARMDFFDMEFRTNNPSQDFLRVLFEPYYSCERGEESSRDWTCRLNTNTATAILKLKPFTDEIQGVSEH